MSCQVLTRVGASPAIWHGIPYQLTVLDPGAVFLHGRNVSTSAQFGEDGLLAAVLERVGATNRWCFEVGAGDGEWLSNTKVFRDAGWAGLLIEADDTKFDALTRWASPTVRCVRQKIEGDDLDRLLARCQAPADLDVGVIDIDGQDYWLWKHMTRHRPRIMLVEYSGSCAVPPEGATGGQAGAGALIALGREKGYVALARTNVNLLFCRTDVWLASAGAVVTG